MNKNTVELVGFYGSDEIHALSAWTSTSRELDEVKKSKIPGLLKTLVIGSDGNLHGTPFEKSALHFLVTTDIASHIHIIKHRIGVPVNGESARYKELKEDKYYLPNDWENIKCSDNVEDSNEMSLDMAMAAFHNEQWLDILERYVRQGNLLYHQCVKDLEPVLGRKRAKESARFFKTYNSQITADVMFNFRSFVHFQKLRNAEHAQVEIRYIAKEMLNLIKSLPDKPFQHTIAAFGLNDEKWS
jgi:flavin-dependent thymidylate synthase